MSETWFDVAVIGAGQAGLAISYLLTQYGMRHIVLERERIGESWRTQRWNSFALNSPNRFNMLPGDVYDGANPDGFESAHGFISYLEGYASRWQLPVQEHARVVSVERNSSGYHVTSVGHGTIRRYDCRQVVVTSGAMNAPRIPSYAKEISPDVRQYHTSTYRAPSELPDGAVLVVGSAQSGIQVAEDLVQAGRRVYLSTSAVGRAPRRYRGKDILDWLLKAGFYDVKTEEVTDPREFDQKPPQISGVGPLGHTLSLQSLARKGAVVLGKLDSAGSRAVTLQPNAAEHVKFSDEISRRLKALIDRHIAENQLAAPPPEPDPADEPDADAACASSMKTLDLEKEHIRTIIWATGFTGDFSYLKDQALGSRGLPVHSRGISNVAGLYFVGLPWLRKRKSGFINGMVEDATVIAEHVKRAS